MSISSDHDVKLKTTENAWKPKRLDSAADKSEEEKQTEELYKNVRGILNKLTPQKFDTLIKKFYSLPISSETRLQGVIKLIFEQAVGEPRFSTVYANMCKVCSKLGVSKEMEAANAEKEKDKVCLRKLLINRCQQEFESNFSKADLNIAKWLDDISNCTDPEKKEELQANFDESERNIRMQSVGNIRFIGELFKFGMLTPAIMYRCIEQLLSCTEEKSLECLCTLLTTIGKDLENQKSANPGLNPHFAKMADLAQNKENSKVSPRVRFMLRDVIDLRNSKWVPRREDSKPTAMINKEAERESMEASMALIMNQPAPYVRPTYDPCFSYDLSAHLEEQMTDDALMIFEEYLQDLYSIEDIKLDLEQYYTRGWIARFVEKALSICLDEKPPAQNKIGGLLAALLGYNVIPVSVFVEKLGFIYEMMDDIAIYDPRVWKLQAHVVVPIIAAEEFNFGNFKEACKHIQRTNTVSKLLVPVLQFLSKAKGEGFARKIWDLSNVSIKDFMAEEGADVNAFIKEHSLDFLVGEAPRRDQPASFD